MLKKAPILPPSSATPKSTDSGTLKSPLLANTLSRQYNKKAAILINIK